MLAGIEKILVRLVLFLFQRYPLARINLFRLQFNVLRYPPTSVPLWNASY